MGFAYSNNGLSWRAWDNPGELADGEIYFVTTPAPADLSTAFPGYAAAVAKITAEAAYQELITGGMTVTSTGTPALNGTYAIDQNAQSNIAAEAQFISAFSEFTNGATTDLPWALVNGSTVEFPTTAAFMNFAKAAAQLVAAAKLAAMSASAMPNPSVTIA